MVHTLTYQPANPYRGNRSVLRGVELFAGVGGFRLGLERASCSVVWSNQWEPSTKRQHASECYVGHFGASGHVNEDIKLVLDRVEFGCLDLPQHDLLVGGFPCQDYSVARPLNQAAGLVGKKGVLWWEIYRLLRLCQPRFIVLENVDRLLKSPATQRGRDFAVMLACLAGLGYTVEWRVVNAADYGFPQRRRRVFIVGEHTASRSRDPMAHIGSDGVLARALPVQAVDEQLDCFKISRNLDSVSLGFGLGDRVTRFRNAGLMQDFRVWSADSHPDYSGPRSTLGDVLQDEEDIPPAFFIPSDDVDIWRHFKGAKSEPRRTKAGFEYLWSEGAVAFPDALDKPSRTVLTGEGGPSPSRFKHVIESRSGRLRRLTPVELERLNGFPDGWTYGAPDNRRSFLMGNALVVGIVEKIISTLTNHAASAQANHPKLLDPVAVYSPRV